MLPANQWFQQPGDNGVYWLSIAANYGQDPSVDNPWGWLTVPQDPSAGLVPSAAAMTVTDPTRAATNDQYAAGAPTLWPVDSATRWDQAFELRGPGGSEIGKWSQPVDRNWTGLAVEADRTSVASDFICDSTGPITNITIMGSWLNDIAPIQA